MDANSKDGSGLPYQHLTSARQNPSAPQRDRQPAVATMGALQVLPTELFREVIPHLDLSTVMAFRAVNRRAADLVDSTKQYQVIASAPARDALRHILKIGTGRWITCQTLRDKMYQTRCDSCDMLAEGLYLLTCKRVCDRCSRKSKAYLPMRKADVQKKFGLDGVTVEMLPCVTVTYLPPMITWGGGGSQFPHVVGFDNDPQPRHVALFDHDSALNAGIARHGSVQAMEEYVKRKTKEEDDARIEEHKQQMKENNQAELGFSSDFDNDNPNLWMAIPRGMPTTTFHMVQDSPMKQVSLCRKMSLLWVPWLDKAWGGVGQREGGSLVPSAIPTGLFGGR